MYHLFAYSTHYPNGGLQDYIESFDTIDDAKAFAKSIRYEHYEIVKQKDGDLINSAKLIIIEVGKSNSIYKRNDIDFIISWKGESD